MVKRWEEMEGVGVYGTTLVGLVVMGHASGAEDQGSNPACDGIFLGRVIPVT